MCRSRKKPNILKQVVLSQGGLVSEGPVPVSESEELRESETVTQQAEAKAAESPHEKNYLD